MSEHFYQAFENQFRSSRPAIQYRLQIYQSILDGLREAFGDLPLVLDVGSGCSEWLEMLSQSGFVVAGTDSNAGLLRASPEHKLHVASIDAMNALAKSADSSLALVSALHLIERLPFSQVQLLLQEALRVLRPGGILILATPNPENIVVGAHFFYLDPTHNRLIPPQLLHFMSEHYGFARSHIWRLQEQAKLASQSSLSLLDVLQGVGSDYALIAQKAAPVEIMTLFDRDMTKSVGMNLEQLAQRYDCQIDQVRSLQEQLLSIHQSSSWKITAPLRQLSAWLNRVRHQIRLGFYAIVLHSRFLMQSMVAIGVGTLKHFPRIFSLFERLSKKYFPRFYTRAINCYLRRKLQSISPPPLGERGQKIERQLQQTQIASLDD